MRCSIGVATVIFLTTGNATIQLASDPDYRGRVTALWSMALVGTTPIGSPIIGALSDVAGPRYALALGAAACLAAVIIGRWPADGRRRLSAVPVTSIHAGVQGAQPLSIWPMPFADSSDFARNPAAGLSAISSA